MEQVVISKEDVRNHLQMLKPYKSTGLDGIYPRLLKECASALCGPLQALFQKSLDCGELPMAWKEVVVKPIYRKGSKHEMGSYHPVSLTPIVSQVMESVVKKAIMTHLLRQGLLSKCQYGFIFHTRQEL